MVRLRKENFILIGISYKTAPVEIRERFSFNKESISAALKEIHNLNGIRECVVVSTCNRTEIYAFICKPPDEVREEINRYILEVSGMEEAFLRHFFFYTGNKVIEHLFNVTSGLESMILGETQIFGQIKYSYAKACETGCTGSVLNRLFHQAFQVGKLIRNKTSISEGIVSVSSAAVLLGKKIFGGLEKRKVLLVGAGKIGKICAKQLVDNGIKELYITNRTSERANELAEELSGKIIPFESMAEIFDNVDIIITSAASRLPLITKNLLIKNIKHRNGNPLVLIDLGVPRNIEPDVAEIKNTHLFNIDNLEDVTVGNRDRRKTEAVKAKEIIGEKIDDYCTWLEEREVIPVINNLRKKCENIRLEELKIINNRVSAETYEAINLVTRRIVRKILHNPTITMRTSESGEVRDRLVESIKELFIDEKIN
ncbi:glutamyl-tRNA reductase [Candidatus Latescibacterota bacterium]